jgi:hypothetical protein
VLAGILLGLVPALTQFRGGLSESLNAGSRAMSTRIGQRTRQFLVVSEFALALILLVGAGLLLRSFAPLQRVDPGLAKFVLMSSTAAMLKCSTLDVRPCEMERRSVLRGL